MQVVKINLHVIGSSNHTYMGVQLPSFENLAFAAMKEAGVKGVTGGSTGYEHGTDISGYLPLKGFNFRRFMAIMMKHDFYQVEFWIDMDY